MITNDNEKCRKVPKIFLCDSCDYKTSQKSHYVKHLQTDKHKFGTNDNKMITNDNKSAESAESAEFVTDKQPKHDLFRDNPLSFTCCCGHAYKFNSGLSRHKLKCSQFLHKEASNNTDKELILSLIKENSELKTMMLDTQAKVLGVLENGTHNTNCNNKTFNLQFFLNDTCKDAMNIMDFVNNLQLQLSDLEKMGEIGYVNGLSNIILKNLKDMDVASRPIHCTDAKREILYVKDEDKWDKEANGNPKMRTAIKHIAHKNTKLLNDFKDKHPNYKDSSSKISDVYNKLMIESMGGKGDNDLEKENKIIKKIIKEVILEKDI
uniref:C2H2-type domain-containing protein n=1 Tax=viral metagenome TaxID=1070528 RepID=A0A6C0LMS2_9ZZZZ